MISVVQQMNRPNLSQQLWKEIDSVWKNHRDFLGPFVFVVLGAIAIYGVLLIHEHVDSAQIANHSLLNFTPQLTVGLVCLTLGGASCVGMIVRAVSSPRDW